MKTTAILDSYWVLPGQLLAGEYPGALDEQEARERLRWLLEQGVTAWLDLTEEHLEGLQSYHDLLADEAHSLEKTARYLRMPIQDFSTPTPQQMQQILDTLQGLIDDGQTVYLHCYGGIGRTGMTIGCYLQSQGWEAQAALQQIAAWRKAIPNGWKRSPETEAQRQFVLNWGKL